MIADAWRSVDRPDASGNREASTRAAPAFGVSGPLATLLLPDKRVARLIALARDLGVSVFDTAPFYGSGTAERRLARALAARPDDGVRIMTKAGTFRRPGARLVKDFRPEAIGRSIADSLARLPRIDRLFLHGPRLEDLTAELCAFLNRERATGRIGGWGVCTRDPEVARRAVTLENEVCALMTPVHAWNAQAMAPITRTASRAAIEVYAIEVMRPAARPTPLPPRTPEDLWRLARAAKRRLVRAAPPRREGPTMSPIEAIARAAQVPGVDHILFTTTKPDHLRANAAALS